jgi:hypothetical protein
LSGSAAEVGVFTSAHDKTSSGAPMRFLSMVVLDMATDRENRLAVARDACRTTSRSGL